MSENDQFAAVRAALGNIYHEQGPQAFYARLAQETNDVDGYIAWSLAQPLPAVPTVSAADFLGTLRGLNFADAAAFARVADSIDNIADGIIPLAVGAKRKLFVAPTTTDLTFEGDVAPHMDGDDGDSDEIPAPPPPAATPDERAHPWVAKLVLAGELAPRITADTGPGAAGSSKQVGLLNKPLVIRPAAEKANPPVPDKPTGPTPAKPEQPQKPGGQQELGNPGTPIKLQGGPPQSGNIPATPAVRYPRFVYPLGRLLMQDIRPISEIPPAERRPGQDVNISKRPLERTNYAIVVDVARDANKAVWAVYNRAPYDPEVGDYIPGALPQNDPLVFPGPGPTPVPNPDMAMLFPALADWRIGTGTGPGALPNLDVVEGKVRESKVDGAVVARQASVGEVNRAVAAGVPASG